ANGLGPGRMVLKQAVAQHVTRKGELHDLPAASRRLPQKCHDASLNVIKAGPRLAPVIEHGFAPKAEQTTAKAAIDAAWCARSPAGGNLMGKRDTHVHPPRQCTQTPAKLLLGGGVGSRLCDRPPRAVSHGPMRIPTTGS